MKNNNYSRLDLYLRDVNKQYYTNTEEENVLVNKFITLYNMAKSARDNCDEAKPENVNKWRKAYLGTLNALTKDGVESKRKSTSLRKLIYEIIESKVDNSVPMPKLQPRYKSDLPLVDITENYLKFEVDRILTKYLNDKSERATYVDGTVWYKVGWDSLDNTHSRSGDVKIEIRTVDQVVPQPGVTDYKQLEYIFEITDVSVTRIYDLYGKLLRSNADTNNVKVISCYYLNEDRIVGLFSWSADDNTVICNEKDWQIRKLRTCKKCKSVVPQSSICNTCGHTSFKYENAKTEILSEPLLEWYNPYEVGETDDISQRDHYEAREFLSMGSEVPFYTIRQLPFVPRPAVSSMDSIYGISEVGILLEMQDGTNKILTKALDKTMKSGAVVTKPNGIKISDTDDTFKLLGVRSAEEAAMVQTKQIVADTSQDIVIAQLLYESAKSSSGITDSFQGKKDTTATSGKAKQYAAAQTAGRIESLRVMKSAAFAGVYELVLKYLLAFSDEKRKFVKVLPNGKEQEMTWTKYMFLDIDTDGEIYYRDDFHFSTDPAATLSQNRVLMWQETQDKLIQGALGPLNDPRTLELFWNIMDSLQYPLSKVALAGIKENEQHLPVEIEQAIMQNPQILQLITSMLQEGTEGRGGARPNSGPKGTGMTHATGVERTNERNRAASRSTVASSQQMSTDTGGQIS